MPQPSQVSIREVQTQLLAGIRSLSARADAFAKDKDAEGAKLFAEAARQLADAWAALQN